MKILTYNILYGGEDKDKSRIHLIEQVIRDISPTVLTIQEAELFDKDNYAKLKHFKSNINLPYWAYSKGYFRKNGRRFDVATFSVIPLQKITDFNETIRNGGLNVVVDSEFGKISICNTHLTPHTEDERLVELDKMIESQLPYDNKIILGDLNSLARVDNYSKDEFDAFNSSQIKKFLKDGEPRYDVTDRLLNSGYIDVAYNLSCLEVTVPTASNVDVAHECPLRLDYVFVSQSLLNNVSAIKVEKTDYSDKASDHYPVVLYLEK